MRMSKRSASLRAGLSALCPLGDPVTWGVAPCRYGVGPLALKRNILCRPFRAMSWGILLTQGSLRFAPGLRYVATSWLKATHIQDRQPSLPQVYLAGYSCSFVLRTMKRLLFRKDSVDDHAIPPYPKAFARAVIPTFTEMTRDFIFVGANGCARSIRGSLLQAFTSSWSLRSFPGHRP